MKFHSGNLTQKIDILIQPFQDFCVWHRVLSGRSELHLSHLQPVHQARSTLPGRQNVKKKRGAIYQNQNGLNIVAESYRVIERKIHTRSHALKTNISVTWIPEKDPLPLS